MRTFPNLSPALTSLTVTERSILNYAAQDPNDSDRNYINCLLPPFYPEQVLPYILRQHLLIKLNQTNLSENDKRLYKMSLIQLDECNGQETQKNTRSEGSNHPATPWQGNKPVIIWSSLALGSQGK